MLKDFGWLKRVKLLNRDGNLIDENYPLPTYIEAPSNYRTEEIGLTGQYEFNLLESSNAIMIENKGPGGVKVYFQSLSSNPRSLYSKDIFSIDLKVEKLYLTLSGGSTTATTIVDYTYY